MPSSVAIRSRTCCGGGGGTPWSAATAAAVAASTTSSRAATARHQTVARRLTARGSDNVRWNSARRSASEREARRRSRRRSDDRPWTRVPRTSPVVPPATVADTTRRTRAGYGPPMSTTLTSSPPMAGSRPSATWCAARPIPCGAVIASAARIIIPAGTGAARGRTASISHAGATLSLTLAADFTGPAALPSARGASCIQNASASPAGSVFRHRLPATSPLNGAEGSTGQRPGAALTPKRMRRR